jgi:hypothetical protein
MIYVENLARIFEANVSTRDSPSSEIVPAKKPKSKTLLSMFHTIMPFLTRFFFTFHAHL